MRPGEKLYEELSTLLEDTAPTAHEKIRIYVGNGMAEGDMEGEDSGTDSHRENSGTDSHFSRRKMVSGPGRDAGRLVVARKEIVLDYSPSAHLLKRVVGTRDDPRGRAAVAKAG